MAIVQSDGNGGYIFSKRNLAILTVAVTIIGIVVGMAIAWGSMTQAFADHVSDSNIHWSKTALDSAFVPRGEIDAKLDEILRRLDAMQADIWEITH